MTDVLRIFVVGCPRSGTTLVQSLLAAHPALTGFTESHVFDKAFSRSGGVDDAELRRRLDAFGRENQLDTAGCRDAAGFIALLDGAAASRGARGWVEKTPDHVFRIPVIARSVPGAKFIHVVRRAQGVLPSLHAASRTEGWRDAKPWWECAAHWLWALRESERWLKEPGHAAVGYERLTADPRGEVGRLLAFLGLAWDDAVLRDYAAVAPNLSAGEPWKANATQPIADRTAAREGDLPWVGRVAAWRARRYPRVGAHLRPID